MTRIFPLGFPEGPAYNDQPLPPLGEWEQLRGVLWDVLRSGLVFLGHVIRLHFILIFACVRIAAVVVALAPYILGLLGAMGGTIFVCNNWTWCLDFLVDVGNLPFDLFIGPVCPSVAGT